MRRMLIGLTTLLAVFPVIAEESRWEKTIQGFEQRDREQAPPNGEIVFVGSSSIRFWDTDEYFPDLKVINRGFGGSQVADSVAYAHRIVIPYAPRIVVLYAGDNDIAGRKSADDVLRDTKEFIRIVHEALPDARIGYVAIKPSLARWKLVEEMRAANAKIKAFTEKDERLFFVDIDTPMLGEDGKPRKELFVKDGLHLSPEGYELWTGIIRPQLTNKPAKHIPAVRSGAEH